MQGPTRGYVTPPGHQGQIVTYSYADAGQYGVIERVHDASDRTTTYRLYPWLAATAEAWAAWDGDTVGAPHTSRRGRPLTEQEADRLLDGDA
jgi:hypothetical protein